MTDLDVLRHLAATLAYRAAKAVRDVPPEFPNAAVSPTMGALARRGPIGLEAGG